MIIKIQYNLVNSAETIIISKILVQDKYFKKED